MKKSAAKPNGLLTKTAFRKLIGCDWGTIQRYERAGMPVEPNNRIDRAKGLAWINEREQQKAKHADLKALKTEADIAKIRAAREKSELEIAVMRGKLHSIDDCTASLGQLLVQVWMEVSALPARIQSAHPEIPALEATATSMVNATADRLAQFFKAKTGKELKTK